MKQAFDREIFALQEYIAANRDKHITSFDYLYAIFKLGNLPYDVFSSIKELFFPQFTIFKEAVYLREMFSVESYNKHIENSICNNDIPYWINLIEITEVLPNIGWSEAKDLASIICDIWNFKLEHDKYTDLGKAIIIEDNEYSEIFVTIKKTT